MTEVPRPMTGDRGDYDSVTDPGRFVGGAISQNVKDCRPDITFFQDYTNTTGDVVYSGGVSVQKYAAFCVFAKATTGTISLEVSPNPNSDMWVQVESKSMVGGYVFANGNDSYPFVRVKLSADAAECNVVLWRKYVPY